MKRSTNRALMTGLALATVSVFTASANASIPEIVFEVVATNDAGTATFQVTTAMGEFDQDGNFLWQSGAGSNIQLLSDGGELIATLDSGVARYIADPVVAIAFAVIAGGSDTNFSISSGILGYAGILNADARASASMGITDNNGDGAFVTTGGAMFNATYNGGTNFAGLLGDLSAPGAFDSNSQSDVTPASGFTTIPGVTTSSAASFDFTLSANDSASGNGVFVVQVPAPATLAVAGFGLAALRRRR